MAETASFCTPGYYMIDAGLACYPRDFLSGLEAKKLISVPRQSSKEELTLGFPPGRIKTTRSCQRPHFLYLQIVRISLELITFAHIYFFCKSTLTSMTLSYLQRPVKFGPIAICKLANVLSLIDLPNA
jgi:hypothetical protein